MEIKNIKPKYRIGDTFQRIGTKGYSWWKVEEIVYDAIEPVYVLKLMPSGKGVMEVREFELYKNLYSTTISNL